MRQIFSVLIISLFTLLGRNVFAQTCNSSSTCLGVDQLGSGIGVSSVAQSSPAIIGNSQSAYGVHGLSTNSNGVQGDTQAAFMSGVVGISGNSAGNGVAGQLTTPGAGSAVYGNNNSSTGWAGNFVGRVWVQTGLDVAGTCISGNCSSDERLKKNIRPLAASLGIIVNLRPVSFEWRKTNAMERSEGTQVGFLAQDVEQVEPSWVGVDDQGFKTINMNKLTPMLVDSIRELKAENDNMLKGVAALAALVMCLVMGAAWLGLRRLSHHCERDGYGGSR